VFHFASAEYDGKPDFVALPKKFAHLLDLDIEVVVADFGPDAKLFDLAALVLFPGFLELLFALVSKFGKVRQFADRRIVLRCDFYQI
jgi:hypothetical protein